MLPGGQGGTNKRRIAAWPSGWVAQLVRAPARRAGDPGWNPGPGENFSLKLLKR